MMKVVRFLKFAWKLLKYNIGTLLVFEILYKFTMIVVFRPVLMGLWRLSLKVRGLSFLSDETIGIYLKGPAIWIILFLLILGLTFFTLLDISCIITCLHASYRKQKMPHLALLRKGTLAALNIFKQKHWGMWQSFNFRNLFLNTFKVIRCCLLFISRSGSILHIDLFTGSTAYTISVWKNVLLKRPGEKAIFC